MPPVNAVQDEGPESVPRWRRLLRSRVGAGRLRDVLSLARGTVLAQLVFVFATPVLTRIYSAAELGLFGVLTAVVLIAAPLAGMSYGLALPLPRRDEVAIQLVRLGAWLAFGTLVIACGAYAFVTAGLGLMTAAHPLQPYAFVVLASVWLFVVNESLGFWFIRQRSFAIVADARVVNAASLAVMQLAGYLSSAKLSVLLGAYPAALLVAVVYQLRRVDRRLVGYRRNRAKLLRTLAWRYRRFPLYSSWGASLYELSQALPLFVLSAFFGHVEVGYFFLARRIGLIPTSVVGRAISQVNHAEMPEHHRSGALAGVLARQIRTLQWLSIVPAALLAWQAPALCARLLGEGWEVAGLYLQLMTPYVVVRFCFAPVHAIHFVAEWQREAFWVELASTALSAAALVWLSAHRGAHEAVAGYFAVLGVSYLVYRSYQMHRLGAKLLPLLGPALLQLAGLGGAALLLRA